MEGTLSDEDEIRAAVFQYQFDWFGQSPLFKYYFISVAVADSNHRFKSDADPSPSVLMKFVLNTPPVRRYSEARIQENVFDKSTGEAGVLFRVAQITSTSPMSAYLTAVNTLVPVVRIGIRFSSASETAFGLLTQQ